LLSSSDFFRGKITISGPCPPQQSQSIAEGNKIHIFELERKEACNGKSSESEGKSASKSSFGSIKRAESTSQYFLTSI